MIRKKCLKLKNGNNVEKDLITNLGKESPEVNGRQGRENRIKLGRTLEILKRENR